MVASQDSSDVSIVVFGSTGVQGSSVISHLIASSQRYRITGITRDITKSAALALQSQGVKVFKADLNLIEEISQAVKGAQYVFSVTNSWEAGEMELDQGKNVVDAIKSSGSDPLLLWSGLPSIVKVSGGKYANAKHFDVKVYEYAKSSGIKIVSVEPASYFELFAGMMAPRKANDGSFAFAAPVNAASKVSFINCQRDYGAFVVGAIETGKTDGRIFAHSEKITFPVLAEAVAKASGKNIVYFQAPREMFLSTAGPAVTDMFAFFSEYGYYGGADLGPSKGLVEQIQRVNEWAQSVEWDRVLA